MEECFNIYRDKGLDAAYQHAVEFKKLLRVQQHIIGWENERSGLPLGNWKCIILVCTQKLTNTCNILSFSISDTPFTKEKMDETVWYNYRRFKNELIRNFGGSKSMNAEEKKEMHQWFNEHLLLSKVDVSSGDYKKITLEDGTYTALICDTLLGIPQVYLFL